jgi:hypothetical protein
LICFHGSNLTEFGPDLGWGAFATRLEHHVIGDGDFSCRRDLFYEPLVEQTAGELDACLDAAIGGESLRSRGMPGTMPLLSSVARLLE